MSNGMFGNNGAKSSLVNQAKLQGTNAGSSSAANQATQGVKTSQNFNQASEIPERRKKYLQSKSTKQ